MDRDKRWAVIFLGMATLLYFFANLQRVAVPGTIFNQLQITFGGTATAITAVGAVFMYTYALIQLLIGLLVDKYGGGRVMISGSVLFCLGAVIFPLSDDLGMVYASRFLVGLGAGSIYLSMLKETDRLFPESFAMFNGFELMIGYSGGVVGTLPLAMTVERFGWRTPLLVAGLATCGAFVLALCCFMRSGKAPVSERRLSLRPFSEILRNRTSWLIFGSSGIIFGIYYTVLACVGKKFLEDFAGMESYEAASCTFGMVVISSLVNMSGGVVSKICGNRRRIFLIFAVSCSSMASGLMLLGILRGFGGIFFMAVFFLYAVSSGFLPISNALIREVNSPQLTGAAVSMLNFLCYILVALWGNAAGKLLDIFGGNALHRGDAVIYPAGAYMAVFIFLGVFSLVAIASVWRLPESFGKNMVTCKVKRTFALVNAH